MSFSTLTFWMSGIEGPEAAAPLQDHGDHVVNEDVFFFFGG